MRLWIAEKPSLAREIAAHLPGPRTRRDGAIECDDGKQTVTWCFGHLLEQVPPEAYNPEWKSWRLDHLPLIPPQWQLRPRSDARGQLASIRKLLASATIVHAGDPDREGQLLVDEVLAHFGNQKSVLRCLLNATDATSIRRAVAALEPNAKYADLSASALARQRADWLVGMSATRAATITGRKHGYSEVLSIGRVQTPTLALVVARDLTSLVQLVQGADAKAKSAVWDDAKVTAHHAIVPTTATTKLSALTEVERKIGRCAAGT